MKTEVKTKTKRSNEELMLHHAKQLQRLRVASAKKIDPHIAVLSKLAETMAGYAADEARAGNDEDSTVLDAACEYFSEKTLALIDAAVPQ